ncbi:MAG: alkaline phosphatase [Alistipes sp.]|nr:alkaline phosphatase [Alistipes sp.]
MKKLLVVITGLSAMIAVSFAITRCESQPEAKYVFYFIGDGMGVNQVRGTEIYNTTMGLSPEEAKLSFTDFPVQGIMCSYSGTSYVTDSAAAGTALATGIKARNDQVGLNVEEKPHASLLDIAAEQGYKSAIVSNVAANHATPTVFFAHQTNRKDYEDITRQTLEANTNFLAGASLIDEKDNAPFGERWIENAKEYGWSVFRNSSEAAASDSDKVLLLGDTLARETLRYAIDCHEGDIKLKDYTSAAIEYLERKAPEKFFMMIEGGHIDYALHNNDLASSFVEINDMDESVKLALEFYKRHPKETLIVVVADHETGGLNLGGYNSYELHMENIIHQRSSIESLTSQLRHLRATGQGSWERVKALLQEQLGLWGPVEVTPEEEKMLRTTYQRSFIEGRDNRVISLYADNERLAYDAIMLITKKAYITWGTMTHTGAPVPYYVMGVGAESFADVRDNTHIPQRIAKLMGGSLPRTE